MRIIQLSLAAALAVACLQSPAAAQSAKSKSASAKSTATAAEPLPPGVPKGAQALKSYYWRWADPKGIAWIYHQTPFGIVKDQENEDDRRELARSGASGEARTPGDLKFVSESGDTIEFARETPFGMVHYTAKRADLNQEESDVLAKNTKK